ncbi:PREDICTED: probable G-protein coupled receptor 157 [Dipodomys ordii]|uniref:Probable G-protein coupled receptor 157 n=1 Tax=Dipodomys ordii TaxID=10020 RepID=A0A1S3GG36_DIPOR|nr:PREDICTED: probable G-protein coupled receptor 157 [Dipodomys ordii]
MVVQAGPPGQDPSGKIRTGVVADVAECLPTGEAGDKPSFTQAPESPSPPLSHLHPRLAGSVHAWPRHAAGMRSWGVPLVITATAVALKKIGYDASDTSVGWCWIDLEAEDRLLWMLLTGKLWETLAYVLLPLLYLLVRKHINRAHEALSEYRPICEGPHLHLRSMASVADKKLILIPFIFICLRVWSTVRFVLTLCGSPAVQTPVLVVLHGIGNTFQGGANCIMFVLCTQAVRSRLVSLCSCPCRAEGQAPPPGAPAPPKPGAHQGCAETGDK